MFMWAENNTILSGFCTIGDWGWGRLRGDWGAQQAFQKEKITIHRQRRTKMKTNYREIHKHLHQWRVLQKHWRFYGTSMEKSTPCTFWTFEQFFQGRERLVKSRAGAVVEFEPAVIHANEGANPRIGGKSRWRTKKSFTLQILMNMWMMKIKL